MNLCHDLIRLTALELKIKDDKTISNDEKEKLLKIIRRNICDLTYSFDYILEDLHETIEEFKNIRKDT